MNKKNLNVITREKWLRHAVELLDTKLFNGDLDLFNRQYQVSIGRCGGKKGSEVVFPYQGEDVSLDDFFPVSIQVSWSIVDPVEMLGNLAQACIHAFFDEPKCNKRFRQLADKYYFEAPYNKYSPSTHLTDILNEVYTELVKDYGEFPGYPIVIRPKEKKVGKKNTLIIFCDNCGIEYRVNKKTFEKSTSGLPTCGCGTKMAIDCSDELESNNLDEKP